MKSKDDNTTILTRGPNNVPMAISIEQITNTFICEGLSAKELADRFSIPVHAIEKLISDHKLQELRAAHVKHGLAQLQNMQLVQADKLMNIESQFKRMRILQLEKTLEDFMAYYSKHGHFYKLHPVTGDILKDTDGIPLQLRIPNVARELTDLKESVTLSQGLKQLLGQIDDIINKPKDQSNIDPNVIDMEMYNDMFKKKQVE